MNRPSYYTDPKPSFRRELADRIGAVFSTGESIADQLGHALHGSNEMGHPSPHVGPQRHKWGDLSYRAAAAFRTTEQAWHANVANRFPIR